MTHIIKDDNGPTPQDLEIFKIVTEHFRQDTREFWNRASFYLIAHAGLFSAFVVAYPALIGDGSPISLAIPILGLITAVLWSFVLRGAIQLLQNWRNQVIKLDEELDRFKCYVQVENLVKQKPYLSPSYLTQFLPVAFASIWLSILIVLLLQMLR
jgi:hypothetical protein